VVALSPPSNGDSFGAFSAVTSPRSLFSEFWRSR
jgi:hypothetical protein